MCDLLREQPSFWTCCSLSQADCEALETAAMVLVLQAHGLRLRQPRNATSPGLHSKPAHLPRQQLCQLRHRAPCGHTSSGSACCRAQQAQHERLLADEQPSTSHLWTPDQGEVDEHWGLSPREVQALGLTRDTGFLRPEPDPVSTLTGDNSVSRLRS